MLKCSPDCFIKVCILFETNITRPSFGTSASSNVSMPVSTAVIAVSSVKSSVASTLHNVQIFEKRYASNSGITCVLSNSAASSDMLWYASLASNVSSTYFFDLSTLMEWLFHATVASPLS